MSLPSPWVDRIFEKLLLTYGRNFLDRWTGLDIESVKADWAFELDGFDKLPQSIKFALENLNPDRPPSVREFRALAYRCPKEDTLRVEPPPANPEKIAAALLKMAPARTTPAPDMKDWARRLVARHKSGDYVSPYALKQANAALGTDGLSQ